MPSVAIKGGMPVLVISTPLIKPHSVPTPMPATIGTAAGRSTSAGYIGDRLSDVCARLAATTAVRAISEPEERSMPVVMITCVTPTAIMPIIAT